ncbi:MAG: hypothetical protein ACOZCL_11795 [Bacillota bacterium]
MNALCESLTLKDKSSIDSISHLLAWEIGFSGDLNQFIDDVNMQLEKEVEKSRRYIQLLLLKSAYSIRLQLTLD